MREELRHIISKTLDILNPNDPDNDHTGPDLPGLLNRFPPPRFIGKAVPCIVSTRLGRFLWVDDGIEDLCGYTPEDFLRQPMRDFLPCLHTPEHALIVWELFMKSVVYVQTHLAGRMDIQISMDHILLGKYGDRKRVIAHVWPLHWDDAGNLTTLGIYYVDISFLGKGSAPSLNILSNGKLITSFSAQLSNIASMHLLNLTQREMELLMMEARGKCIDEISAFTGLSKATIYTHRRNILQRSGHTSTQKLIDELRERGVI